MAIETPTWIYKSKGDKQTASEMNQLAQSVIMNATELSNIKDDFAELSNKTYNPETYSGMGSVILRKNMANGVNVLTQEMINQANTIYVIRYDFTLTSDVTIPANCIIEFDGGSISGAYIIDLNNCYIQGIAKFNSNIIFAGSINNNLFDATWILDGDLGYKINKAQVNFKNLYVPFGSYIVETPIVINNIQILRCYANITYSGVLKNCEGVFLLKGGSSADIYINRIQPNDSLSIDYTNNRTINCIGVEIRNINNSNIHINQICYFNENLRVSNDNAWGCCYNHFYLGMLYSANACIRVYQQDGESGYGSQARSWCHENSFHSGRLTHITDNKVWGDWNYIVLGGPALDLPSYKITGIVDSYDTVNALVFENMSIECIKPPFIARNTSSLSVINCRNESNPYLGKFIGSATEILFIPKEGGLDCLYMSDFSEATYVGFRNNDFLRREVTLYKTITGNNITFKYAKVLSIYKGAIIDTSKFKIFAASIKEKSRFVVIFLDNNNNITENYSNKLPNPYVYYNSTSKLFISGTDTAGIDCVIPEQINKVFIGVNIDSININKIVIYTRGDRVLFTDTNLYGTTEQRPNALPANIPYFSTSLNRPIYYNGSSYVDGAGNVITWPVTATVLNITYPKPIPQAINGEQYSITISPTEGYNLPNGVTVKMNNIQLTHNTDFTYDSTTGEIIILGSGGTGGVTGPVWFSAYA